MTYYQAGAFISLVDGSDKEIIGVMEPDICAEPIPCLVNLGLNKPADDFVTVIHYAIPIDSGDPGTPSDTWRQKLPMAVLQVRGTRPGLPASHFAPVSIEARSWVSKQYLQPYQGRLATAVATRWGKNNLQARLVKLAPTPVELADQAS